MRSPAELTSTVTIGRATPSARVAAALAVLAAGCSIDQRAVGVAPSREDSAALQNQAASPLPADGAGGGAATAPEGSSAQTDGQLMPAELMQAAAARPPAASGPEGSSASAQDPAATPKPALSCQSPLCCASATLQGIGFLPGGTASYAAAVSGDGRTIVGSSMGPPVYMAEEDFFDMSEQAVRWVPGSGMLVMEGLESGSDSNAEAVNFDGSVIAGWHRPVGAAENGARWTPSTGSMQLLGDATVTGSSNDGSIFSASTGTDAFRWQQSTGLVRLEPLAGFPSCHAEGISADGTTVVGYCLSDLFEPRAVRWTADGPLDLGILPNASESWARGVSADGSVVVGWSRRDGVNIAFRWTRQAGMLALDTAEVSRITNAVSADGSVIVGGDDADAFLWTAGFGAVPLSALLPPEALQAGTSGKSWVLDAAQGISADGTVIVGTGYNPQGGREGWRITLGADCLE